MLRATRLRSSLGDKELGAGEMLEGGQPVIGPPARCPLTVSVLVGKVRDATKIDYRNRGTQKNIFPSSSVTNFFGGGFP